MYVSGLVNKWVMRYYYQYYFFNLLQPQMKYLAAYALLALSGKKDISAGDIKTLLNSVQTHATDSEINQVIKACKGKPIHQLIADGQSRLGSSSAAPAAKADKKEPAKKQEPKKKEEPKKKQQPKKVEEPPKEQQEADLGDLFG